MNNEENQTPDKRLVGMLGQFETPEELLHACDNAREAGIRKMDAYTPFPVHGIERAMGITRTVLPFFVLAVGMAACVAGVGLQWYTNATEWGGFWSGYQFKISGKPFFSLPANIPVAFEIIVLSSAFAAFFGMLILNQLPKLANPLHRIPRFKRATNDRFFLALSADEENFDVASARDQLTGWGASEVEEVWLDETDKQLPAFLKTLAVLVLILLTVPPVLVYRARGMTSRETRLHFNPDMDFQVKFNPQTLGPVNADDTGYFFDHMRSSFAPVPGTIARGQGMDDVEFLRGIRAGTLDEHTGVHPPVIPVSSPQEESDSSGHVEGEPSAEGETSVEGTPPATAQDETPPEPDWMTRFPEPVKVSQSTLERGQHLFNIYCVVCHGYSGEGDGLVNQRAMSLTVNGNAAWTTAKSFYDPEVIDQPVGRIFDTISNGRATMGPYGSRIEPADRWAIVLYVKAIQETRRDALIPEPQAGEGDDVAAREPADPRDAAE